VLRRVSAGKGDTFPGLSELQKEIDDMRLELNIYKAQYADISVERKTLFERVDNLETKLTTTVDQLTDSVNKEMEANDKLDSMVYALREAEIAITKERLEKLAIRKEMVIQERQMKTVQTIVSNVTSAHNNSNHEETSTKKVSKMNETCIESVVVAETIEQHQAALDILRPSQVVISSSQLYDVSLSNKESKKSMENNNVPLKETFLSPSEIPPLKSSNQPLVPIHYPLIVPIAKRPTFVSTFTETTMPTRPQSSPILFQVSEAKRFSAFSKHVPINQSITANEAEGVYL
jgi:hypothetical protein